MLWLPFCCCQWQGIAAAWPSDEDSFAVSCASACCRGGKATEEMPSETPSSGEPCGFECCIRGELPPPVWQVPIDRDGVASNAPAIGEPDRTGLDQVVANAHAPPIGSSPPAGVPVVASVLLQV